MDELLDNYRDIIDREHPVSKVHQPMSMLNRAAQFAPFAALTGYDDAVEEVARHTESRIELSADEAAVLSRRIERLVAHLPSERPVKIRHFVEDGRKSGGHYVTTREVVSKLKEFERELVLASGAHISIDAIISIGLPRNR